MDGDVEKKRAEEIQKAYADPSHPLNRFIWQDGDVTITPPSEDDTPEAFDEETPLDPILESILAANREKKP